MLDNTHNKEVGQRIKDLRIERKLSQEELAKMCGFNSKSTISKIETGDRSVTLKSIESISKALKVNMLYLLDGRQEVEVKNKYFADYQVVLNILEEADEETMHQIRLIVETFRKE